MSGPNGRVRRHYRLTADGARALRDKAHRRRNLAAIAIRRLGALSPTRPDLTRRSVVVSKDRAERLAGRYQRLLLAYPRWHRALHGDDMLTALLDGAAHGRGTSTWEAVTLVLDGVRCRLRVRGVTALLLTVSLSLISGSPLGAAARWRLGADQRALPAAAARRARSHGGRRGRPRPTRLNRPFGSSTPGSGVARASGFTPGSPGKRRVDGPSAHSRGGRGEEGDMSAMDKMRSKAQQLKGAAKERAGMKGDDKRSQGVREQAEARAKQAGQQVREAGRGVRESFDR